jgi:hypothetical protein
MQGMKALLHFGVLWRWTVTLAVALMVSSCTTNPPKRDEPSPFAPQWRALHRH